MADPFDYLESRDDADELIGDFGTDAFVRRTTNTGTNYAPTPSTTDYATKAVRVAFTKSQRDTLDIEVNDERWLVAAGPLAALGVTSIAKPDSIVVGGAEKPVITCDTLSPAGTVVLFDCQVRV